MPRAALSLVKRCLQEPWQILLIYHFYARLSSVPEGKGIFLNILVAKTSGVLSAVKEHSFTALFQGFITDKELSRGSVHKTIVST